MRFKLEMRLKPEMRFKPEMRIIKTGYWQFSDTVQTQKQYNYTTGCSKI